MLTIFSSQILVSDDFGDSNHNGNGNDFGTGESKAMNSTADLIGRTDLRTQENGLSCRVGLLRRTGPGSACVAMAFVLLCSFPHQAAAFAGPLIQNASETDDRATFFESRIRPLLIQRCIECHGAESAEGKLRLDLRSGWERGGDRGPAIVPGDPSSSLLIRAVSYREAKLQMPPPDSGGKLTDREIADLTAWVRSGAFDPRDGERIVTDIDRAAASHWSFQPIRRPLVDESVNPIDYLVEQKLSVNNGVMTETADIRTLVRRATFDLLGLPPTEQQSAVGREDFPRLISELLSSPRYGERWGRHWLDVARYSDAKDGVLMYGDARIRPFAYTYRDYVIRAFNDDKPYDQFIREQLAADQLELPADSPDLAAMGLLTLGRMFDNNRHDVIDDQIDVVGRGLLGLTIACARCHDHKFDPIPTADYYSLYGVFASGIEPYDRPRTGPVTEAGVAFENEFLARLKEVYDQQQLHYQQTLQTACERTPDYLVQVATTEPDISETTIFFLSLTPDQLRPQITRRWRQLIAQRAFPDDPVFGPWHDLMHTAALRPDEWRKRGIDNRIIDGLTAAMPTTPADVARTYGEIIRAAWMADPAEDDPLSQLLSSRTGPVWFPPRDVASYLSRQPGDAYRGLLSQLDAVAVKHHDAAPRAMIIQDAEILCDPVIFQRGDPGARGTPVPRQFLSVLSGNERVPFRNGSGRLELADAIAAADNPLTARVWVNRVWMHHFGEPLVENPGDFGLQSPPPVHLELLDYLADYFIRSGWRLKPLHELIMTSRTYQRSSIVPETDLMTRQLHADPGNTLLWRANRRRLDLEQMRDSLLMIAGELDDTMYGRPFLLTDDSSYRRTVYAFVERQNIPAVVQSFDFASADTSTPRRTMTTVPQQALFALNSTFMLARADALARRCRVPGDSAAETAAETAVVVDRLYLTVFGRPPEAEELAACEEFLRTNSAEQLAQVLLMSNELMFVD